MCGTGAVRGRCSCTTGCTQVWGTALFVYQPRLLQSTCSIRTELCHCDETLLAHAHPPNVHCPLDRVRRHSWEESEHFRCRWHPKQDDHHHGAQVKLVDCFHVDLAAAVYHPETVLVSWLRLWQGIGLAADQLQCGSR